MALVRVVIPTYNRATSVRAALHSVQRQTFTDVEIVVADDGSADDTIEQVGEMARADRRIRVLRLAHGGVAQARNAGIDAPGSFEYVAFLDADDLWRPDHLASCIPLMQRRTDVTLMYGAFETIDYTGTWTAQEFADRQRRIGNATRVSAQKESGSIYVLEPAALLSAFLRFEIFPLTSTTVIRRASVGAGPWFDETLMVLEDGDLFLRLATSGGPWAFVDRPQATANFFGDNLTRARDLASPVTLARLQSQLRFTSKKLTHCRTASDRVSVRREVAQQAYVVGQCFEEQGSRGSARGAYIRSLCARPSYLAAKGLIASSLPTGLAEFVRRALQRA